MTTTDNGAAAGESTATGTPAKNADGTIIDPKAGAVGEFTVPADLIEWGKSKGYDDLGELAKSNPTAYKMATSYRSAEKMLGGSDKIIVPKDAEDVEGWNSAYDKLGRPADPTEYEIPLENGVDPKAADFLKPFMHKAGLNQEGAKILADAVAQFGAEAKEAQARDVAAKAVVEKADLEKEWGADFARNEEGARRVWREGMKAVGVDATAADQMLEGLQQSAGLKNTMKLMNWINGFAKTTEDTFEGATPGGRPSGAMSPGTAQQRKDAMMSDPVIAAKYRDKDHKVIAEVRALNDIIAQGKLVDSY